MKGIGAWLMALIGPLGKQLLVQLGFSFVTFTGFSVALNGLLSQAQSYWGQQAGDVAALIALSGANTALSIVCGAMLGRIAFVQLKRLVPH